MTYERCAQLVNASTAFVSGLKPESTAERAMIEQQLQFMQTRCSQFHRRPPYSWHQLPFQNLCRPFYVARSSLLIQKMNTLVPFDNNPLTTHSMNTLVKRMIGKELLSGLWECPERVASFLIVGPFHHMFHTRFTTSATRHCCCWQRSASQWVVMPVRLALCDLGAPSWGNPVSA